jgi:hypothetical protein
MVSARLAFAIVVALVAGSVARAQQTTRVSVDGSGGEANGLSASSWTSADGQVFAFGSRATNLVAGDTNAVSDIFVHDRANGTTTRVSVDSAGAESNGLSDQPALSANGTVVAFTSYATNLVAGDTNGFSDVFVHDLTTGATERANLDSSGSEANYNSYDGVLSSDGRFVAFTSNAWNLVASDTNQWADTFVRDRATGITERVSVDSAGAEADGPSFTPSISADGRYVAFQSYATNLVAGDTNSVSDIFVHDRTTGVTERVSIDSAGVQANNWNNSPAISADGNVVAWVSKATNLVAGDRNHHYDIFVHDRTTGITDRASVDSAGNEGDGDSGRNLSHAPALSTDGRWVAFESYATNLVPGDTNGVIDVFVHDRASGATERVSVDSSGGEGDSDSSFDSMAPDALSVSFTSRATNLVTGDTNATYDVFVHDPLRATWSNYGAGLAGTRGVPAITPDQDPVLGATITVSVDNSRGAPTSGLLFLGFQRAQIPTHFGGDLLLVPVLILPITFAYGADAFPGTLPSDPAFAGFAVDLQVVQGDPGAPKGVSFTPGLELVLGF